MILYKEALHLLENAALKYSAGVESVPLNQSIGRILAETVFSKEELPSFTNSAMDGFALIAEETWSATEKNPVKIPVRGILAAGDLNAYQLNKQEHTSVAVEIMTGAPIPDSKYDAVVRLEDVELEQNVGGQVHAIIIRRPVLKGANIRLRGSDFPVGGLVLEMGTQVAPEHIMACASLGICSLNVKKIPKVAVISTGRELVPQDTPVLSTGLIRNSTGPYLKAALTQLGISLSFEAIVLDDPHEYQKNLERIMASGADIILSTGAVSMGKYDFIADVLSKLKAHTHFHKASIRPGKPILFAEISYGTRTCAFFGLPGNPVSTVVGLRFFVMPFIRSMMGLKAEKNVLAKLTSSCQKPEGLRCFFKGRANLNLSSLQVEALQGQASYIVSALLEANCWVIFPEQGHLVEAGSAVEVFPLHYPLVRGIFE